MPAFMLASIAALASGILAAILLPKPPLDYNSLPK